MPKFYPPEQLPELDEQISSMIRGKRMMDDYEDQLRMAWEAKQKKDEPKDKKKNPVAIWIMLGVMSVPVMVLWNLTIIGSIVFMFRMLKGLN